MKLVEQTITEWFNQWKLEKIDYHFLLSRPLNNSGYKKKIFRTKKGAILYLKKEFGEVITSVQNNFNDWIINLNK